MPPPPPAPTPPPPPPPPSPSPTPPSPSHLSLSPTTDDVRSQRERWIDQLTTFPHTGHTSYPLTIQPVPTHPDRGLGVFTRTPIPKHRLILEYCGDLLTLAQKLRRDAAYAKRVPFPGSYAFEFRWEGRDWARDATEVGVGDEGEGEGRRVWGFGRYVNHSREGCNLYGKVIAVGRVPHLCFFSARAIEAGDELLIDYKDRSKENREANPWLDS